MTVEMEGLQMKDWAVVEEGADLNRRDWFGGGAGLEMGWSVVRWRR